MLERLTEKNLIKDFFEDLAAQRLGDALEGRAARLGCDLDRPHVVVAAAPVDDALERAVASLGRGTLLDRRDQALRALVPVARRRGATGCVDELRPIHAELGGERRDRRVERLRRRGGARRTASRRRATRCSARP